MTGTKGKRDYFFTHVVTEEDCKGKRLYINQRVGCFVAKKGVHPAYYGYLLKDNKILDAIPTMSSHLITVRLSWLGPGRMLWITS